ncbi:MAG TPA: hypothetical protein VFC33_03470 [Acidimicrobiia bacterium]|nr:hypothetical protein [Acidimicrobiia bacterium]
MTASTTLRMPVDLDTAGAGARTRRSVEHHVDALDHVDDAVAVGDITAHGVDAALTLCVT